jgi:multidrug efflux pump subunit AcrA (membrane-fusion protein)
LPVPVDASGADVHRIMNKPFQRRSLRQSIHLYALGAAAVVVAYLAISQIGADTSSARTETETVTAEWGVVQSTTSGTGNVEAGVDDEVNFATSGTLNDVDVHIGEHVSQGQILATLDPTSAELTLAQARINLKEAETALTDAEDGDASTGSTGGSSTGGVTADTAEQVGSGSTEFVSDQVADTTTMTTTTTKTVTAPSKSRPTKPKTETTTTTSSSASAPSGSSTDRTTSDTTSSSSATVSATTIASDKLTVESDEQTVKSDELAVNDTTLRAPVSGTVASLADTSPGESVSAGSSASSSTSSDSSTTSSSSNAATAGSLGGSGSSGSGSSSSSSGFAEIVNTNTLTMTVPFSESDISEIKLGQSATVTLDALTGVELAAKVTSISPTATESDSVVSYDVTLTIDQTASKVKPGMSASASVIINQAQGVTVPTEAVSGSGSTGTVTLDENGKHVTQQVIVGLRGTSRDEIASGVKANQQLIVTETLPSLGTSTSTTSSSGTSGTGTLGGSSAGGFGSGGFSGAGGGRFSGGPPSGAAP